MACPDYIRCLLLTVPGFLSGSNQTGNACWTKRNRTSFSICHIFFLHSPWLCGLLFLSYYTHSCSSYYFFFVFRWKLTVQWSIDSHKESERGRGACKFMYVIRFWWLFPCLGFHVIILWRKLRLRWWKPNTRRLHSIHALVVFVWVSFAVFFIFFRFRRLKKGPETIHL